MSWETRRSTGRRTSEWMDRSFFFATNGTPMNHGFFEVMIGVPSLFHPWLEIPGVIARVPLSADWPTYSCLPRKAGASMPHNTPFPILVCQSFGAKEYAVLRWSAEGAASCRYATRPQTGRAPGTRPCSRCSTRRRSLGQLSKSCQSSDAGTIMVNREGRPAGSCTRVVSGQRISNRVGGFSCSGRGE